MAAVSIKYKGSEIASMDATGTKTLTTSGTYCEGDIQVAYTAPAVTHVEVVSGQPSAQTGKNGYIFVQLGG